MEWRECTFEHCTFEDIKLCTDISIVEGWFWHCKGRRLKVLIKQLSDSRLCGGKFEDVKIGSDITETLFTDVEIRNLEKVDVGREVVWKENTLENCIINGGYEMKNRYFIGNSSAIE